MPTRATQRRKVFHLTTLRNGGKSELAKRQDLKLKGGSLTGGGGAFTSPRTEGEDARVKENSCKLTSVNCLQADEKELLERGKVWAKGQDRHKGFQKTCFFCRKGKEAPVRRKGRNFPLLSKPKVEKFSPGKGRPEKRRVISFQEERWGRGRTHTLGMVRENRRE